MRNNDDVEKIMTKYAKFERSIEFTNIKQNPLSSTMIRAYIKTGNYEKLNHYMDKKVVEYIKKQGLYK